MSDTPRQSPYPDAPQAVPPHTDWTAPERWAWANIVRGRIADMARFDPAADEAAPDWLQGKDYTREDAPNPQEPDSFKPHHVLSELFLRLVLFHAPYSTAPERPGVRIGHALMKEGINWSGRESVGEIWLDRCHFAADVILQDLRVRGLLRFEGSALSGALNADRLDVAGGLFCQEGFSVQGDVRLLGAKVGGQATFNGATLHGALRADGLEVEGHLFCREGFSVQGDLRLLGAKVGGQAAFHGATLHGALHGDRLNVANSMFCNEVFNTKGDVRLLGAKVGGQAAFSGATLHGALNADRLNVAGSLFCSEGFNQKGGCAPRGGQGGRECGLQRRHATWRA
jgi:hypothetical protein